MLDMIDYAATEAQIMDDFLGLNGSATAPLRLVQHIEEGLPVRSLDNLVRALAPDDVAFKYRLVPKPTLTRRMRAVPPRLTPEESNRIARIARLWVRAMEVWQDEEDARGFLMRRHPLLEGRRPIDLALGSEMGADLVDQLLGGLQYSTAP